MVRVTTLASGASALTGLLAVAAWFDGLTPLHDTWVALTLALALVLIVDSLLALVGPKRIFYSSAVISALLATSEWIGSGSGAGAGTLLTVVAAGVTLALSVVAARFDPPVSEQSHPMNLPVFG